MKIEHKSDRCRTSTIWFGWLILFVCLATLHVRAQEPASTTWIVSARGAGSERLARVLPEVHSVVRTDRYIEVRSAGISLHYLGPFQTSVAPAERLHQFLFRIPKHPSPETKFRLSVRPDVLGVFVNGMPIYNQFEAASYQGQNLWHFDSIASGDDGTWTASGHPRAESDHSFAPGLLEKLIADASGHSPIIGFAFDGYPIYGPWAYANAANIGANSPLRRMRSSYRLRAIKQRTHWPDGTALMPGQYGPDVNEQYPLGTFTEDYEYVAGAGDLDEFNGCFVKTPEYPGGTYAYFLATEAGNVGARLAFPYLLAHRYFGHVSEEDLNAAFQDGENARSDGIANAEKITLTSPPAQARLALKMEATPTAWRPARLSFQITNACGVPIRHLEYVHERPMHLIVVSEDLAEFDHIHPELVAGDRYEVTHAFQHGGRYRLYADFTAPGAPQRIETFEVTIAGTPRSSVKLMADENLTQRSADVRITMNSQQPLRAGEDIELTFALRDAATGKAVTGLEPYLGAWAHFVIIDEHKRHFIHAHPIEQADSQVNPLAPLQTHNHTQQSLGPPPDSIRVLTSFPQPGLYKLWAQFQRDGRVIIQPFVLRVAASQPIKRSVVAIPADAIKITIGPNGFQPASVKADAAKSLTLAITRAAQPNCGNRIVFPSLGIARDLPLGETILIELPAQPAGELRFTCGMGMYKGQIVVE